MAGNWQFRDEGPARMNEEMVREITVLNEALENAEAEVERLREALKAIAEWEHDPADSAAYERGNFIRIAREALGGGA